MGDEALGQIGGVVGVDILVAHVGKPLTQLLGSNLESLAEIKSIKILHILGDEHYVIGRLIVHHQLAVAVIKDASRGIYRLTQIGIGVSRVLVGRIKYLEIYKAHNINHDD